jgi:hypothetical protein
MLPSELLERVRHRLRDTRGNKRLWSDYELLVDYGNIAVNKMLTAVRKLIIDSTTAVDVQSLPLCTLPLVAGTANYAMSPKIIEIAAASLNFETHPLEIMTVAEMDAKYWNWRNFGVGAPRCIITDLNTDSITFWPTPHANPNPPPVWNPVATFTVHRRLLKPLALANGKADDTIPLTIREEYQEALVYGIMAEAYAKDDAETKKPDLAALNEKRFADEIEKIKADVLRRSTVNRGVRCRRAFV